MSGGIDNPLTNSLESIDILWSFDEDIDNPLEQLIQDIGKPLEKFARVAHKQEGANVLLFSISE
jgi:hypothetical protein